LGNDDVLSLSDQPIKPFTVTPRREGLFYVYRQKKNPPSIKGGLKIVCDKNTSIGRKTKLKRTNYPVSPSWQELTNSFAEFSLGGGSVSAEYHRKNNFTTIN
jgi:hypothetical protein